MEITGERYVPEYDADWTLEHTHRYLLAKELVRDAAVLDIACGDGYGSFMLAGAAKSVTGVDICPQTVARAREKYQYPGLTFAQGSVLAIPLPDACMDVVVSFETLEHLAEQDAMLDEIRRVLRPGGLLIISTPDRDEFARLLKGEHNEYHVKELLRSEFETFLQQRFNAVRMLGQRVLFGSVMGAEAGMQPHAEGFISWRKNEQHSRIVGLVDAVYLIALASDGPLPAVPSSVLKGAVEESDHARAHGAALRDALGRITDLTRAHDDALGRIADLEATLADRAAELCDRAAELRDLYASRSWRVTAPLRFLANAARRCLHRS